MGWLRQISGYDSCAHLSEETKSADRNAAAGIMLAVGLSVILGLGYILALLFSIQVLHGTCPCWSPAEWQQHPV